MSNEWGITRQELSGEFNQEIDDIKSKSDENEDTLASHEADNATAHGINLKANKAQENWITATLQNGWTQGTNGRVARYMKDEFGFVYIDGLLIGGTKTQTTILFTLPVGYRPPHEVFFPASTDDGSSGTGSHQTIAINANGEVRIHVNASKTNILLGGIVFRAA